MPDNAGKVSQIDSASNPELKPCPFCGDAASYKQDGHYHVVVCHGCNAEQAASSRRKVTVWWNTRTPVAVKPLEWVSVQSGIWKSGHYSIWHQWASDGKFHASVNVGSPAAIIIGRGYPSLEAAQAACQSDHERRIISALIGGEA